MEALERLIDKHDPDEPSLGSITYSSENSHNRIRVYNLCEGSAFASIFDLIIESQ